MIAISVATGNFSVIFFGSHLHIENSVVSCIAQISFCSATIVWIVSYLNNIAGNFFSRLDTAEAPVSNKLKITKCDTTCCIEMVLFGYFLYLSKGCVSLIGHHLNLILIFIFFWISTVDGIIFRGVAIVLQYGVFGLAILNAKAFAILYEFILAYLVSLQSYIYLSFTEDRIFSQNANEGRIWNNYFVRFELTTNDESYSPEY